MNGLDIKRLVQLREQMTPRPWPITGPNIDGMYAMNCGPETLRCRSRETLEFITLAVALADVVEARFMKKEDIVQSPNVDNKPVPAL